MRLLLVFCVLTFAATGCIEVTGPEVVVTAEPVPEELEGARWQELPVRYCIVESPAGFKNAAEFRALTSDAFAAWGVPAVDEGVCENGITRANGINEVGWGRPPEAQGGGNRRGGLHAHDLPPVLPRLRRRPEPDHRSGHHHCRRPARALAHNPLPLQHPPA